MMMSSNSNALIPSSKVLPFLLEKITTLPRVETICITKALGRVLADDINARVNVPEFANAAMDGYAVCIDADMKPPYTLNISDRIPAGSYGKPLKIGGAARIFTGAPVPKYTYGVVAQEECKRIDDTTIEIHKIIDKLENIRPKANDISKNDTILTHGKCLTPADIALIASVGIDTITVYQPIKIGVFFSGDELLEPHKTLTAGKIYNSNQYALIAMLERLGATIINLGIIADDLQTTKDALSTLAQNCDVIITTGGVSVGEEDYLRVAVSAMGEIDLWNVKMKPGKPLTYGSIHHPKKPCHFIGLPGNPVSAIATFCLFIRPLLKKLMGMADYNNISYPVQIDYSWRKQFRCEFVRVKINYDTIPPTVSKYHKQGSDVLMSTSWADGFAEMTDETTFMVGDRVQFYPLWQ